MNECKTGVVFNECQSYSLQSLRVLCQSNMHDMRFTVIINNFVVVVVTADRISRFQQQKRERERRNNKKHCGDVTEC